MKKQPLSPTTNQVLFNVVLLPLGLVAAILTGIVFFRPPVKQTESVKTAPVTISAASVDIRLQQSSCVVKTGSGSGSGVFIPYRQGVWILTCAHVVASAKQEDGSFADVEVRTVLVENGREVGYVAWTASVSSVGTNTDAALLQVRKVGIQVPLVFFPREGTYPVPGEAVVHIGSPLGPDGAGSVIKGNLAAVGRVYKGSIYDQTTVAAFPGCSGGPVWNSQGQFIGMVALSGGPGLNLIVPVRELRRWAEASGFSGLFD
jgi:S1-C subfamily serine protease